MLEINNKLFCGREEICMCINCRDRTSQKKKIVMRKLRNTWKLQNSFTIRTPLKKDVTFDDIRVEKTDHGELKSNVKERDETSVGTNSNTLMGLAFFLFILIWKKLKKKLFKHSEGTMSGREEDNNLNFPYCLFFWKGWDFWNMVVVI